MTKRKNREKKTKPGEFKRAQEKAKLRQAFFDKMKKLREGEEIWVTMRDCWGDLRRMKVIPYNESRAVELLLVKARNKFVIIYNYEKDGSWVRGGNHPSEREKFRSFLVVL